MEVSYPDYIIVKYKSNGIKAWDAHYNGPSNLIDVAVAMVSDKNGNVYVTGYSYEPGVNYLTIKYSATGVLQWVARYAGQGTLTNVPTAIAIDNRENIYVTGYSGSGDSGSKRDCVTIKYNSQGTQQWAARFNGPANGHDMPSDLTSDNNGNVYITGSSDSPAGADYMTIKYNTDGIRQWIAHYNGPGDIYDGANAIAIDNSGNIYVTGISFGRETSEDYATIKYNALGVEQWVARYEGSGNGEDNAVDVALDSIGNVYVTGKSATSRIHPFNHDYATVKYNSMGIEQWVIRYNGFANSEDGAKALAVDDAGNVYVTGRSVIDEKHSIYTTLKYTQAPRVSVKEKVVPVVRIGQLLPNYPNPFNASTKLKYVVSRNCHVTLKLFDLTGQEIAILVDGQQIAGEHAIN